VLDLIGLAFTVSKDFLAGALIALHHLDGEDVVDLDVMGRDAVVQETGREHHVVPCIPELWVVLVVELHDITRADEPESRDYEEGQPEPHEEGRVVQGAMAGSNDEAREDWAHNAEHLIDLDPVVVDNAEEAEEGVLGVLALTHFEGACDLTDETGALGEALVHEVLDGLEAATLEHPGLETLRHFFFFLILNYIQ